MSTVKSVHPKVSCLMVTANRSTLARRSIQCFLNQTYPHKELVIIDDGTEDYEKILQDVPSNQLNYTKLPPSDKNVLGTLRNRSLEEATGEYMAQWDDDDWYHPDRLKIQVKELKKGYDACCLNASLMHLDDSDYCAHPYIGKLRGGVPGSIIHRRDDSIRYPDMKRAEDSVYLGNWNHLRYSILPQSYAYLFIRCFHGDNTWERGHFLTRIRNTVPDWIWWFISEQILRNIFIHPRFKLDKKSKESFYQYVEESKALQILAHKG